MSYSQWQVEKYHKNQLAVLIKISNTFRCKQGISQASLVAQLVKNLPAMQKTYVRSLGREDPLEEGMATYSNILAWRIAMDRGAWRATVYGVTKSWARLSD